MNAVPAVNAAPLALLLLSLASALPAEQGSPQWSHADLRGDVYYEIFVRSFADADGDGIGDLAGLISRLDYLNDGDPSTSGDLGVDGLWLMPVFESPSYHGYDVTDYLTIEPDYGTNADFRRLLEEAHRRGMAVIVDFVMNHTSAQHPWFQAAIASPASPYRDWYVWSDDDPGWTQPWSDYPSWHPNPAGPGFYYGIFWGGMPDLNFSSAAVRTEIFRLAEHWLAVGVDGYRLDATRHLFASGDGELQNGRPETHLLLKDLSARVRAVDPGAVMVGENWTDTERIAPYFGSTDEVAGGDELPLNFNFPLADAIVEAVRTGTASPVREVLVAMQSRYPEGALDAPFLRNHDQIRLATELGGDPDKGKLAAAVLLTLPGVPFLYYGEEIGLQNGGPGRQDELKRTPMPWTAAPGGGFTTGDPWHPLAPGRAQQNVATQDADPDSLLSCYRAWIRYRKSSPALTTGDLAILTTSEAELLLLQRSAAEQSLLVAHNFADTPRDSGALDLLPGQVPTRLAGRGEAERRADGWHLVLGPRQSAVWELAPGN